MCGYLLGVAYLGVAVMDDIKKPLADTHPSRAVGQTNETTAAPLGHQHLYQSGHPAPGSVQVPFPRNCQFGPTAKMSCQDTGV